MEFGMLQIFWFCVIGVALFVFAVLDGFDLGVGMLLPIFSKNIEDKRTLLNAIWPVWDGNELWGLIAAGGTFAIFPQVFANLLSLLYPAVVLLMITLMFRPVSFEFWFHDEKWRGLWEKVFLVGSFLVSFVFGAVLGITVSGFPFTVHDGSQFLGSILALLTPLPILSGLTVASLFLVHGTVYIIKKTEGEIKARAQKILKAVWPVAIILFVLFAVTLFAVRGAWGSPLVWIVLAVGLVSTLIVRLYADKGETRLFLFSGATIGSFIAAIGAVQATATTATAGIPIVLYNNVAPALSVTMAQSSPPYSLGFLAIVGLIVLSCVIFYTALVYRVFKGKVRSDSIHY